MKAEYTGINYGSNTNSNRDHKTGIRFGVIPQGEIFQAWCDCSESIYPNDCDECEKDSGEYDEREPIGFTYLKQGYTCTQSSDSPDIFVEKSPYYTYAQFCSPCAPGACYLRNEVSEDNVDNKCYCFGHDWFEDNKAPYTVYSVETGDVIER